MDIFQGVIDLLFPAISFENEMYNFLIYIMMVSIRCGLLAYCLTLIYNILKLGVSAPKGRIV